MVRTAWVLTSVVAVTLGSAAESSATPVTLIGVNGSGVTASVLNDQLIGDVFSFDIENTSSAGFITNLGVAGGDIVDATGFTTSAPFSYVLVNDPASAPDFPSSPAQSFALLIPGATTGILPGETFHYTFTLAGDGGGPLPDITADELANDLQARFRGLSTPAGEDIAALPTPEPATLTLTGLGLAGALRRYRRRRRA